MTASGSVERPLAGPCAAGLEIREVADIREVSAEEWRELCRGSVDATVFQSYELLVSWWETFGAGCRRSRVLLAYAGGRLMGAMPLYEPDTRVSGSTGTSLRLLGSEHADYQCVLAARPGIVAELVRAARGVGSDLLLEELPQFSLIQFHLAEAVASSSGGAVQERVTPCPRLSVRGNEEGVHAVLRKQSLKRHMKSLAAHGVVDVRHLMEPNEIRQHLPRFFEQHIERWRSTKSPSLFEKPENREFYERITDKLGRLSQIVLSVLDLDGAPIAYHFGLRSGADLLWYKPTFDVRLMVCSPGEVLLKFVIEHAVACNYSAVDFTRGNESYKNRFASEVRYNVSYAVTRRRWRRYSAVLQAELRRFLKRDRDLADNGKVMLGGAIAS